MNGFLLNLKAFILRLSSDKARKVAKILFRNALKISTAESCTGGLLSSRLTDISGSSTYTKFNFVTYSNESKMQILGVSEETLKKYGAVSSECAYEMAKGLLKITGSDIVVCTTGIAGPTGDENKPIGMLYVSCGYKDNIKTKQIILNPKYNRKNMKFMFTEEALKFVLEIVG